jgi:hypothetical protein
MENDEIVVPLLLKKAHKEMLQIMKLQIPPKSL